MPRRRELRNELQGFLQAQLGSSGLDVDADAQHALTEMIDRAVNNLTPAFAGRIEDVEDQPLPAPPDEVYQNLKTFGSRLVEESRTRGLSTCDLQVVEVVKIQICPLWPIC